MALCFLESFDHYATADQVGKWTQKGSGSGGITIAAVGRRGGSGMKIAITGVNDNRTSDRVRIVLDQPAPSGDTFIIGLAFKSVTAFSLISHLFNEDNAIVNVYQGGSSQFWLRLNTNGTLSVLRGSTVLGTSSSALTQNVFHYIELKVVIHDSAGTVDLRVDGVQTGWLTLTSQDTKATSSATWDELILGGIRTAGTSAYEWDYDDIYVLDGTGTAAQWKAFKGDTRVDYRTLTANGANRAFTPSTGTDDFAVVDEAAVNGDTDYLTAAAAADKCSGVCQDAPVPGAEIYGIQIIAWGKKTDAGASGHKGLIRIGSTDYLGTERGLATSYSCKREPMDVSPATAVAFTESEFNAAEIGAQKSS